MLSLGEMHKRQISPELEEWSPRGLSCLPQTHEWAVKTRRPVGLSAARREHELGKSTWQRHSGKAKVIGTAVPLDAFPLGTSERRWQGPAHQAPCGHTLALHSRPGEVPRSRTLERSLSETYFPVENRPPRPRLIISWIPSLHLLPNEYSMEHIWEVALCPPIRGGALSDLRWKDISEIQRLEGTGANTGGWIGSLYY